MTRRAFLLILAATAWSSDVGAQSAGAARLEYRVEASNIRLIHTAAGTRTFRAIASRNRDRRFDMLLGDTILQAFTFPPRQKGGLDDRQTIAYGPFTRQPATTMVRHQRRDSAGRRGR